MTIAPAFRHAIPPVQPEQRAVAIVSGGLDSAVLAYLLESRGYRGANLHLVSFDYGQRHVVELQFARYIAARLQARHSVLDLRSLGPHLSGSALTDGTVAVPAGHYADPCQRATVVPNRNAIMLATAYALALTDGATILAMGSHAGDREIYPDCRVDFLRSLARTLRLGNTGFGAEQLSLAAPFVHRSKTDIVRLGARLGVPLGLTWSCYRGQEIHCGTCGSCVERQEAFRVARVHDTTTYGSLEEAS